MLSPDATGFPPPSDLTCLVGHVLISGTGMTRHF